MAMQCSETSKAPTPPEGRHENFTSDESSAIVPVEKTVAIRGPAKIDDVKVSPWIHFLAGGVGGMAGALVTCPLDVVKTRLQSDMITSMYTPRIEQAGLFRRGFLHLADIFIYMNKVYYKDGFRALFKGLGPTLAGVVPARSVNFATYGLGKEFLTKHFSDPRMEPSPWIHLMAGVNAGIVTSTVTNPIWLIKTRLQLDKDGGQRLYKNSWDALRKIVKNEGVTALYRGLSASYLGTVESSIQWVLYERMKLFVSRREKRRQEEGHAITTSDKFYTWFARSGAAGAAKFVASLLTYPHEVVRTRLRQAPMKDGHPKYKGLIHCFQMVVREDGFGALYGGLAPHLLRTVPNSIVMFGTWDLIIRLASLMNS